MQIETKQLTLFLIWHMARTVDCPLMIASTIMCCTCTQSATASNLRKGDEKR